MAWDFLSFGMGQMDGQAGVYHAEVKARLAQERANTSERNADHSHALTLMFAKKVNDMRMVGLERTSRGVAHRAVRILLRDALIEVDPRHPLVNGESGRLLCKKVFDEAYRANFIDNGCEAPNEDPEDTSLTMVSATPPISLKGTTLGPR